MTGLQSHPSLSEYLGQTIRFFLTSTLTINFMRFPSGEESKEPALPGGIPYELQQPSHALAAEGYGVYNIMLVNTKGDYNLS